MWSETGRATHLDWEGLRLAMGTTLEEPPGVLGHAGGAFLTKSLLGPLCMGATVQETRDQ